MLPIATTESLTIGTQSSTGLSISNTPYFGANNALWKVSASGDAQFVKQFDTPEVTPVGNRDFTLQNFTTLGSKTFFTRDTGVWVTDGTTGGTSKLKNFELSPVYSGGNPFPNLTVIGSIGNSFWVKGDVNPDLTIDRTEIWHSDGTTSGRLSLDPIDRIQNSATLGDRLFFTKTQVSGNLFIANDSNANPTQVDLSSKIPEIDRIFTQNNALYLWGKAGDNLTLWKSDGTLGGTIVIGTFKKLQLWDAYYPAAYNGESLASNGQSYFLASDLGSRQGLWRTDGTATGTQFLKSITVAPLSTYDSSSINLSLKAAPGGKSYLTLSAYDSRTNGYETSLWETDGTATGTKQLATDGLRDARDRNSAVNFRLETIQNTTYLRQTSGYIHEVGITKLWSIAALKDGNLTPSLTINEGDRVEFFDLNGKTYFAGDRGLWSTDGTALGTSRISPALVSNYKPVKVVGNKAIAILDTATYGREVWQSDGTEAGTKLLRDLNRPAAAPTIDIAPALQRENWDMIEDRSPSRYFGPRTQIGYNRATGEVAYFNHNLGSRGFEYPAVQSLLTLGDRNWRIAGLGDFDRNGYNDLLWTNRRTGEVALWTIDVAQGLANPTDTSAQFTRVIKSAFFLPTTAIGWEVQGIADFDRDGQIDLFWREKTTGQTAFWKLKDGKLVSGSFGAAASGEGWQVQGLADLDHDGNVDIVWRNSNSGQVATWKLDKMNLTSGSFLSVKPDNSWSIQGLADFDGDGKFDLLWQKNGTDQVGYWKLDQFQFKSGTMLDPAKFAKLNKGEDILGITLATIV
jgi:ELWxxDGT repeat protein